MKPKSKGGGGNNFNAGAYRGEVDAINADVGQWNDDFRTWAGGAIDYGRNDPTLAAAANWSQGMMSGDMSSNPWMQGLYGNVAGVNMNESMDMLRDFLGYDNQGAATPGRSPKPTGTGRPTSSGGGGLRGFGGSEDGSNGGGYHGSSHSGGLNPGGIPDSTVGEGVFSREINDVLDDARLDPANDPTMQPMIDALQREAQESYDRSRQNLVAQIEGAGQFGSSAYVSMMGMANEDYNEAIQGTLAQQYQSARQAALEHQMNALNMVNQRDIASAQIAAQESAASSAAGAQADAVAAQLEMHNQEMQLQGIGMMMNGAQFGLGLQGEMAGLMQNGQLGAGQLALGLNNQGMQGYQLAQGFGELGLGANSQIMGNINNYWGQVAQNDASRRANEMQQQQLGFQQQRYQDQLPWQQMGNMIDVMRGLGDMSGYYESPNYIPSPGSYTGADPTTSMLLGALGGGMTGYKFGNDMFA